MAKTEYAIHDQSVTLKRKHLLLVFSIISTALLVSYIDQQSIGVVLPTVGRDLDSSSTIVWAGTSSLIANTAFQCLYGRLSDIMGRKVVMITACCLLGLGDLLCGFAKTGPQFYAFRGISGVANGGIMALAMMIVSDITTLENRGKYQGIVGAFVGLGNTIGPFLAAAFAHTATWRATFYFLAPTAVLMGAMLYFLLPPQTIPPEPLRTKLAKIDYLGIALSSAGTISLLIPISGVRTQFGTSSPIFISMVTLGVGFLLLFIIHEYKWARLAVFPLRLMRTRALAAMMCQNFMMGVVYFSLLYYLPIFFQCARQMSLLQSAALLAPLVVPQSVSSALAGLYMTRKKRYGEVIWLGFAVWTVGAALQCLFSRTFPIAAIVVVLALEGTAVGLVFQPTLVAAQAHTPKQDRAVVISARNFIRSLGGSTGLAMASTIYSNTLITHVPDDIPHALSTAITTLVFDRPDLSGLTETQRVKVLNMYATAARSVFYLWAGAMACCLTLMMLVKDKGLSRKGEKTEEVSNELQSSLSREQEAIGDPNRQVAALEK